MRTESFEHRSRRLVHDDHHGGSDRMRVYLHGLLLDAQLTRELGDFLAEPSPTHPVASSEN